MHFNRFRIFGRVAHRCTMAKMQRTMHQVRTHLQIETNSCTIHRSIFEGLRIDPAFRLKRSEGRNAGSETQQQDPVKYFRKFGPIWTGLDARSGAPTNSRAWSTEVGSVPRSFAAMDVQWEVCAFEHLYRRRSASRRSV